MSSGVPAERRARGVRVAGTRTGSPPSLLLMLFGDYWLEAEPGFPSAALVTLLGDFGVADAAARAALSRMVKRGLLASTRTGRNTHYRPTDRTHRILTDASRRIVEPSANDGWDGTWSIVAFEIPENSRSLRTAARVRLEWLGFAPLYPEVWICPHDRHVDAMRELAALGVQATPLRATLAETGAASRLPQNAWDLDAVARQYRDLIERLDTARAEAGALDAAGSLVRRTQLLETWLDLSSHDPNLPASLLPADWPREKARESFLDTHQLLGDRATARVRSVIDSVEPGLGAHVERRTVEDFTRVG